MKIKTLSITHFNPETAGEADFEKATRIQQESFKATTGDFLKFTDAKHAVYPSLC